MLKKTTNGSIIFTKESVVVTIHLFQIIHFHCFRKHGEKSDRRIRRNHRHPTFEFKPTTPQDKKKARLFLVLYF